jgi:hypothetical protein
MDYKPLLLLGLMAFTLCTGSSEQVNDSAVPIIDMNISIGGKTYNIHVDQNTTKEFDKIVSLVDELLKTINKG